MILVLSTISETPGVGTYVELQWLVKTHHIQICDLLIEASDIKATSMVLNQFKVRKLNSGVDRIPWFCSRIDQSTTVHCSAWLLYPLHMINQSHQFFCLISVCSSQMINRFHNWFLFCRCTHIIFGNQLKIWWHHHLHTMRLWYQHNLEIEDKLRFNQVFFMLTTTFSLFSIHAVEQNCRHRMI